MHKILIIGTNMMNIYNHRLEMIKRFLSLGMQVVIVAPAGGEEKKLIDLGVNFIDTPVDNRGSNPISDLSLLRRLIKILKQENPDVVLTFYTKTNIYGGLACRITKTPYIENITGLGSAIANGGVMQKVMLFLYRNAVKGTSKLFFQNTQNQEFFKAHDIQPDGELLPGSGVSLTRFQPIHYPSDNTIEFVFISRIIREKGIYEYLDAAREIRKRHHNTVFHVIGPCDNESKSDIDQAHQDGTIVYHGKLFDIRPILTKSHCTVFPSYYAEGMANVLLESAASARPIITTNLPGCGETVDDGVTGFLVKEKDSENLIEVLTKFINLTNDEKREMGLRGRKKMEHEFDRDIVTDAYVKAITKILSKQ